MDLIKKVNTTRHIILKRNTLLLKTIYTVFHMFVKIILRQAGIITFLAVFIALNVPLYSNAQTIEAYELPSVYPVSTAFTVNVNGTEVPVTQFMHKGEISYHYAHFSFSGTVNVKVSATETISSHKIRPLSYEISANANGQDLAFSLSESKYLVIDINSFEHLILLADPAEINPPEPDDIAVTNIMNYGVDSSGLIESTSRIQAAIDSIYSSGGGTLYFPPGLYKVTTVSVKDSVNIYLAGGAVVRGTGIKTDYPEYDPERLKTITYVFLIENASNIRIFGRGSIDGFGVNLADNVNDINDAPMKIRAVSTHHSSNITVEGIIARELTSWAVPFYHSDHVRASHVKVLDYIHLKNSDGINMCASQHGLVENCFVMVGDDSYCAKGHAGEPCHDILFKNSVAYSSTRGVTFGMQAYAEMYDIRFENIDVVKTRDGLDLKHNDGSGRWSDLHVIDLRVDECTGQPIKMSIGEGGTIDNVEVTRYTCRTPGSENSYIRGLDKNRKISNVNFTDTYIDGKLILNSADGKIDINGYAENIRFSEVGHTSTHAAGIMEAEDMLLTNYSTEVIPGASNEKGVVCSGDSGSLSYVYTGKSGSYDITIHYWDENDGECSYKIFIADSLIDAWSASADYGSAGANAQTLSVHVIKDVQIEPAEEILIMGLINGNEQARIDYVEITPLPEPLPSGKEIYIEAESGEVGAGWTLVNDAEASGGHYISYMGGSTDNQDTPPDNPEEISTYIFLGETGIYRFWIRMRHPLGGKDDSIWIRMNEGNWIKWNSIANDLADDVFLWASYSSEFELKFGENTLEIGYRETDTRLDMICLSISGLTPEISITAKDEFPAEQGSFELFQNYPNPFTQNTIIRFNIPYPEMVTLKIYDLFGREAGVLVQEFKTSGTHEVDFHPGSNFAPGLYIYSMKIGEFASNKLMLLTE